MDNTSNIKKMWLLRLRFSLVFFSFLAFISVSNEIKLLKIKVYFKFLSREPKLNQKSFDDLDTYEKNLDFLAATKSVPNEELDDDLMFRITHARHYLGMGENGFFRLKRLRLAGIEYNDLLNHLNNYEELRSLDHEKDS